MKMIKLISNVHQRLSVLKAKLGKNTFSEVIEYLLDKEDGAT